MEEIGQSVAGFAIVDEFEKHLFSETENQISNSKFTKDVSKHLDLIRDENSESLYFRSLESRLDLHRFLVIGAPKTIYYNSYFLFDMILPNDYPRQEPKVTMHAFGQSTNPNLYSNGYVCLSLLGTWSGDGVELWDSESSNLLQVAKSIQGLILGVDEPYYNEPGIEMEEKDSAESVEYSQMALIQSMSIMLNMVKFVPKEFSSIVRSHFKAHCLETLEFVKLMQTENIQLNKLTERFRVNNFPQGYWPQLKELELELQELIKLYGPAPISRTLQQ